MPRIYILAGPNGAGKSTAAHVLLPLFLDCAEFVNADVIARGLSAFQPEKVAFQAGRVMVARLKELANQRVDFAFETTLASRSFAPWLRDQQALGYEVHLFYAWLPRVEMAIERVVLRVRAGGHDVPTDDIRRRYERSRSNFLDIYMPLADVWEVCDTAADSPRWVASGGCSKLKVIRDEAFWNDLTKNHE